MDINRLEFYVPLDLDIVVSELMHLRLRTLAYIPEPELLVAFTARGLGKSSWTDIYHYQYEWMLMKAKKAISNYQLSQQKTEEFTDGYSQYT